MTDVSPARDPSAPRGGWGPAGKRAAVSITFDNLGEAMDLSIGAWPAGAPIGRHYSVTEVLPRILDLLHAQDVRCTYFSEGWSAAVYPDAIRRLRDGGHEVASHGWRHEHWADVSSPEVEATLITRSMVALRTHGIEARGFRPPGGLVTPWTAAVLRDRGFTYVSPAGRRPGWLDGLVALPFRWTATDAYYFLDAFAPLRRVLGDPADALPPDRFVAGVQRALDESLANGAYLSLLCHPFVASEPRRFEAVATIVEMVARHADVWCAPCEAHAAWALEHQELLWADPGLDERSWQ